MGYEAYDGRILREPVGVSVRLIECMCVYDRRDLRVIMCFWLIVLSWWLLYSPFIDDIYANCIDEG